MPCWDDDDGKVKKTKLKSGKKNATSNPAVLSYTAVDSNAPESAQQYEEKKRCKSQDEAKRYAEAKLRELNAHVVKGTITVVGDPSLVAGEVVMLAGFGSFDGNFIIEEARHTVTSSGYTTALTVRAVNTGE